MHLPGPLRAAIGLVATAAEEARHLPDRAIELPMLAVSTALQVSLRAQQRYARLAARGDDVINRRPPSDEPPPWATFDEPLASDELSRSGFDPLDGRNFPISRTFVELFGTDDPSVDATGAADPSSGPELSVVDESGTTRPPARPAAKKASKTPAKTANTTASKATKTARKRPGTTQRASKSAATRKAPAKTPAAATKPAKKTAAKSGAKAAAKTAPKSAAKAPAKSKAGNGKTVNKPRHAAPSRFDQVSDADLDAD